MARWCAKNWSWLAFPWPGPGQKSLGATAAGRTLTGLLRLSSTIGGNDALRRDDVMAWLTGCPVRRPREIDRSAFSPTRWDAISRKAGVVPRPRSVAEPTECLCSMEGNQCRRQHKPGRS